MNNHECKDFIETESEYGIDKSVLGQGAGKCIECGCITEVYQK